MYKCTYTDVSAKEPYISFHQHASLRNHSNVFPGALNFRYRALSIRKRVLETGSFSRNTWLFSTEIQGCLTDSISMSTNEPCQSSKEPDLSAKESNREKCVVKI